MSDRLQHDPARDSRELLGRVDALETLVVRSLALLAVAVLVLGELAPYVTDETFDGKKTYRLVTIGFAAVGYRNEDGEADAFTTAMGVGYLGLGVLTVVLIVLLLTVVWWRSGEDRSARWSSIVAGFVILGTAIQWLLVGIGSSSDRDPWEVHQGPVVYTLGVGLACAVLLVGEVRSLWLRRAG